jgi:hypothetical protein
VTEVLRAGALEGVRALVSPGALGDAVAARLEALGADVNGSDPFTLAVHDAAGAADALAALDGAWAFARPLEAELIVLIAPRVGAAARDGLENLARTLSVEWARRGMRVVAICPGPATSAQEVAELTAFLASAAGAYYSGCRFDLGPA